MVGCDDLYREPGRPLLHYSPRRGASSDANGLVWYDGEWHLHYQHVPCNVTPGNSNCNWGWGHAVSRDLVTWEELPDTLWPDERGVAVSGSCVVDHHNSSGLGSAGRPPMVIFYTAYGGSNRLSHGRSVDVCIVYSTDRGRTWRPYDGNPVIRNIDRGNRDAKVFWYPPGRHWVMVLYIHNDVHFILTSADLLHWQFRSQVNGMHECPELFELPVFRTSRARAGGCSSARAATTTWARSTARASCPRRTSSASSTPTAACTRHRPSTTLRMAGASWWPRAR